MKTAALGFVLLLSSVVPSAAQKVESETSDRSRIVHLKTALNHLTVIEVSEPVVQVASGSPSFRVEWRENKVFIQPTEGNSATNLFIWTASQRLNYELEPAGPVTNMDFAVDETPARLGLGKALASPATPAASNPFSELLFEAQPIRVLPKQVRNEKPIEIWISDILQRDGQLIIRYAARNRSNQRYNLARPLAFRLESARAPQSLYSLLNSQLADEQVAKLKVRQQSAVKVVDAQAQSPQIAPGEQTIGFLTLQIEPSATPAILRLQFPKVVEQRHAQEVAAYLVR
jgi:hypothetical protein